MSGKQQAQRAPMYNNMARMGMGSNTGLEKYLAPLALWGGAETLGTGLGELAYGDDTAAGILDTAKGAGAATAGAIGTASLAAGALSGVGAGTAGLAAASAAAAPVAAIGAGLATGIGIANRGQDYIAETGLLGTNDDGTGKNWSDWGADVSWGADQAVAEATGSETLGTVAGLATCAGTSLVGAAGAAVTGVAGLATDAYDFVTSW